MLKLYAFEISEGRGAIALRGCFKRVGTLKKKKAVIFTTPIHGVLVGLDVWGWFSRGQSR